MNSRSAESNLRKLEDLRRECRFAPVDEAVVARYGRVRLALRKKGHPISENDVWIAATAMANDAAVLTDDLHFDEVDGLVLLRLR